MENIVCKTSIMSPWESSKGYPHIPLCRLIIASAVSFIGVELRILKLLLSTIWVTCTYGHTRSSSTRWITLTWCALLHQTLDECIEPEVHLFNSFCLFMFDLMAWRVRWVGHGLINIILFFEVRYRVCCWILFWKTHVSQKLL